LVRFYLTPPSSFHLPPTNVLQGDEKREGRFSNEFMKMLQRLIIQLAKKTKELASHYGIGKFLNNNVAFFLRDLFTLIDRGLVFEMVPPPPQNFAPVFVETNN